MATKPIVSAQDLILAHPNLQSAVGILLKGLRGVNTPKAKAIVSEYKKYMKTDNSVTYVIDKDGNKISRRYVESLEGYDLYGADPNCNHENDTRNLNGVKCIHCDGWYCA